MTSFAYAIDANIKRFQILLDTSVNTNTIERLTIQTLLAEEKAKAIWLALESK